MSAIRTIARALSPSEGPYGLMLFGMLTAPLYLFATDNVKFGELAAMYVAAAQGLGLWLGIDLASALFIIGLILLLQNLERLRA